MAPACGVAEVSSLQGQATLTASACCSGSSMARAGQYRNATHALGGHARAAAPVVEGRPAPRRDAPQGLAVSRPACRQADQHRQLHRIVVEAARAADIAKRVGPHTLRHKLRHPPAWRTASTSASSRRCSNQRHTARQQPIEGRIYLSVPSSVWRDRARSARPIRLTWRRVGCRSRSPTDRSPAFPRG